MTWFHLLHYGGKLQCAAFAAVKSHEYNYASWMSSGPLQRPQPFQYSRNISVADPKRSYRSLPNLKLRRKCLILVLHVIKILNLAQHVWPVAWHPSFHGHAWFPSPLQAPASHEWRPPICILTSLKTLFIHFYIDYFVLNLTICTGRPLLVILQNTDLLRQLCCCHLWFSNPRFSLACSL